MKKNNFIDLLMRHGVGFALALLVIISLSLSLTAFLGVMAFSAAGLVLCGAVGWGVGGYLRGLRLNQLIGSVLLKYLIEFATDKVSVYFLL